jgi:hypothetical protein
MKPKPCIQISGTKGNIISWEYKGEAKDEEGRDIKLYNFGLDISFFSCDECGYEWTGTEGDHTAEACKDRKAKEVVEG